ncbi:hypothetical protein AGMMS50243_28940 [Betaproteobacteria bacterium]|nr:hypothetical protein AGMMS50243_28940 [Betaproteobacteria bacterium]
MTCSTVKLGQSHECPSHIPPEIFVDNHQLAHPSVPRQPGKVSHDLVELLVVAVNAVLVGADTFAEIE